MSLLSEEVFPQTKLVNARQTNSCQMQGKVAGRLNFKKFYCNLV